MPVASRGGHPYQFRGASVSLKAYYQSTDRKDNVMDSLFATASKAGLGPLLQLAMLPIVLSSVPILAITT